MIKGRQLTKRGWDWPILKKQAKHKITDPSQRKENVCCNKQSGSCRLASRIGNQPGVALQTFNLTNKSESHLDVAAVNFWFCDNIVDGTMVVRCMPELDKHGFEALECPLLA